jgi:hypothetical protein
LDGAQAGTDGDSPEVEAERASVESPAFAQNAKGRATRPEPKPATKEKNLLRWEEVAHAETISGNPQIRPTSIATINMKNAVLRSGSATKAATANANEPRPPISQVVSTSRTIIGVGGSFDLCIKTSVAPMMSISANDTASEIQANLRLDHHVAVSTVIGTCSFREERDNALSFDKLDPGTRHKSHAERAKLREKQVRRVEVRD